MGCIFRSRLLVCAFLISLSALSEGRRCYWCGPLADQVHRSRRAAPCAPRGNQVTACEPGHTHCAVVATSPPQVESRYCVKLYQDECYPLFCNSTRTWKMTCPCRGDLCNGANSERETEAFAILAKLVDKTHTSRIKKRSEEVNADTDIALNTNVTNEDNRDDAQKQEIESEATEQNTDQTVTREDVTSTIQAMTAGDTNNINTNTQVNSNSNDYQLDEPNHIQNTESITPSPEQKTEPPMGASDGMTTEANLKVEGLTSSGAVNQAEPTAEALQHDDVEVLETKEIEKSTPVVTTQSTPDPTTASVRFSASVSTTKATKSLKNSAFKINNTLALLLLQSIFLFNLFTKIIIIYKSAV